MGSMTYASAPKLGNSPAAVSRGGETINRVIVTQAMSASYAAGGDTLAVPGEFGALIGVNILNPKPGGASGNLYAWNGSTAAPKIFALSAFGTEATGDLSAVSLVLELTFRA